MNIDEGEDKPASPWGITRVQRGAMRLQQSAFSPTPPIPRARKPKVFPTARVCRICLQEKPIGDFQQTSATTWNWRCRACRAAQRHVFPSGDPDFRYGGHLQRTYGITLHQYHEILPAQNGVCAICRQPERMIGGRRGSTPLRLSVDHDHDTKAVRGLLCSACNQGIGFFRPDIGLLQAAIEYLQFTETKDRLMSWYKALGPAA